MEKENLFKLAKSAKEKGFTTQTVTTSWTNNYLLNKGKDKFINSMCLYLWLCELRKWLADCYKISVETDGYQQLRIDKPFCVHLDYEIEGKYKYRCPNINFNNHEEALIFGCNLALNLIKTTNEQN